MFEKYVQARARHDAALMAYTQFSCLAGKRTPRRAAHAFPPCVCVCVLCVRACVCVCVFISLCKYLRPADGLTARRYGQTGGRADDDDAAAASATAGLVVYYIRADGALAMLWHRTHAHSTR